MPVIEDALLLLSGAIMMVVGFDAWVRGLELRRNNKYLYDIAAGRIYMLLGLLSIIAGIVLLALSITSLVI